MAGEPETAENRSHREVRNRPDSQSDHGRDFQRRELVSASDTELKTAKPAHDVALHIDVLTQITGTPEQWEAAIEQQADSAARVPAEQCWQEHEKWWADFWDRSWIFANGNSPLTGSVSNSCGALEWIPTAAAGLVEVFPIRRLSPAQDPRTKSPPLRPGQKPERRNSPGPIRILTGGCTMAAWIKPAGRIRAASSTDAPRERVMASRPGRVSGPFDSLACRRPNVAESRELFDAQRMAARRGYLRCLPAAPCAFIATESSSKPGCG